MSYVRYSYEACRCRPALYLFTAEEVAAAEGLREATDEELRDLFDHPGLCKRCRAVKRVWDARTFPATAYVTFDLQDTNQFTVSTEKPTTEQARHYHLYRSGKRVGIYDTGTGRRVG